MHINSLTINCRHDESNLSCVCSTSEVRIDILSVALVERNEAVEDIIASSILVIATFSQSVHRMSSWHQELTIHTFIVREVVFHW